MNQSRKPIIGFVITMLIWINGCTQNQQVVRDIDGNAYRMVRMGNQVWMAEDLRVTHYRNGDPIMHVPQDSLWTVIDFGAWCTYNNQTDSTSGLLFNWYAIQDERQIAPEGWHIPSIDEVKELVVYLGGDTIAGNRLKSDIPFAWSNAIEPTTHPSGFNALPNGYRDPYLGMFHTRGSNGYWWTQTESYELYSWSNRIFNSYANVKREAAQKRCGLSVRCIRD